MKKDQKLNSHIRSIFPSIVAQKIAYPEVVESGASESLARNILWQAFYHSGLLHGQDGPRDKFSVVAHSKMPRPNPHHVIKGKLDNQPSLCVHLQNNCYSDIVFWNLSHGSYLRYLGQDLRRGSMKWWHDFYSPTQNLCPLFLLKKNLKYPAPGVTKFSTRFGKNYRNL